jgi:hypothetical protein
MPMEPDIDPMRSANAEECGPPPPASEWAVGTEHRTKSRGHLRRMQESAARDLACTSSPLHGTVEPMRPRSSQSTTLRSERRREAEARREASGRSTNLHSDTSETCRNGLVHEQGVDPRSTARYCPASLRVGSAPALSESTTPEDCVVRLRGASTRPERCAPTEHVRAHSGGGDSSAACAHEQPQEHRTAVEGSRRRFASGSAGDREGRTKDDRTHRTDRTHPTVRVIAKHCTCI